MRSRGNFAVGENYLVFLRAESAASERSNANSPVTALAPTLLSSLYYKKKNSPVHCSCLASLYRRFDYITGPGGGVYNGLRMRFYSVRSFYDICRSATKRSVREKLGTEVADGEKTGWNAPF